MNKKELINDLKNASFQGMGFAVNGDIFYNGIDLDKTIKLVEQLEEPERLKVKPFIADWFEKNKDDLEFNIWRYIRSWNEHPKDGFWYFMNHGPSKPFETLVRMKGGYEIEKEKLWVVPLPSINMNGFPIYLFKQDGNLEVADNCDAAETRFTNTELEKVPMPYRKFAVPAENE